MGRKNVSGCRALAQSGASGRAHSRAVERGCGDLTMQYILSKASLSIVTRLAHERTLCAFDFDGTLSSIVDHPDQAVMRARTENLLRQLALLYPCLIVSGRARADVLSRMSGVH